MTPPRADLALAGPMGAGKTTVGRILGRMLDRPFVDLDERIVAREGRSIPALFADGEARFRTAESAALAAWIARPAAAAPEIIALGGGALEHDPLAAALAQRAVIVHLDAPAAELAARFSDEERAARPLLASAGDAAATLERLREARAPGYARADVRVSTSAHTPDAAAVAALRAVYDPATGPWRATPERLDGATAAGAERVTSGRGAIPLAEERAVVVLWDSNLPALHREALTPHFAARAGGRLNEIEREGGEGAKTPESLLALWRELLAAGADRDTPLWVVGGGTLTDLGGFAAHSFKRGLPVDFLPTTLVGQLDAALGGKTGVNVDGVKNIVGIVRRPRSVHLDPLFLLTLPDVELRAGLAEAIKSGLVGDAGLVDLIERRGRGLIDRPLPALEEIAARAARVKLDIVARDVDDHGERRALNLGHTLGHALEAASAGRGAPIGHGEAVAIGMIFAARLARRLGRLSDRELPDRLVALLAGVGLPVRPPDLAALEEERLRDALAQDKKRRCGAGVWVLPCAVGQVVVASVEESDVAAELAEFVS